MSDAETDAGSGSNSGTGARHGVESLRTGFAHPTPASRPMVRWWWFGPHVERGELERELDAMVEGGFGGAELSMVYPIGAESDTFLSDGFLGDVHFAAVAARDRGLRFDITLGSGWSFGGPHIGDDLAARNLRWERYEIGAGAASIPLPESWPGDRFVAAYLGSGSVQEVPDDLTLVDIEDGRMRIPASTGPRVILTAVSRLTGQNVKRAAHGAEGPVFDHYSLAATRAHIDAVAEPLVRAAGPELLGSVFCDSLEVYGADWTPDAIAEFTRRRGYDPLPELYLLEIDRPDSPRFRRDLYRTLTELYEQNFVVPLREWASGLGVPFRIQGYGEPPAAVSSYRFADMIEGEGWGWKGVTQTRWASSASHLYGRAVTSSEIWTWVHSPSFRATPFDLRGEAHEHILLGINHFIGHGWPYSPSDLPGTGWMFYASGALDDRNPWWPAMPSLTTYLHRLAWLMRQGDPAAAVAIYAPSSDAYADMHSGGHGLLDLWRGTKLRIGERIPAIIRENGHDFDLLDDDALDVIPADRYRVVVLPNVQHLPDAAGVWLDAFLAAGGTVIPVGGAEGIDVESLADALGSATPPPLSLSPTSPEIGVVHRVVGDADVFFVANTDGVRREVELTLAHSRPIVEQWDAATGEVARRWVEAESVRITLDGYEAVVLVAAEHAESSVPVATPEPGHAIPLDGPWTVEFDASPRPVTLPHRWEDDPTLTAYSGSATYRTTVDIPSAGGTARLDLGPLAPLDAEAGEEIGMRGRSFRARVATPVGEVAVVTVNGERAGVIWGSPYSLELGALLHAGENTIELVISNTAANALAVDGSVAEWAEAAEARWGRRFRMQELDRAADGISSGLLAVPTLVLPA